MSGETQSSFDDDELEAQLNGLVETVTSGLARQDELLAAIADRMSNIERWVCVQHDHAMRSLAFRAEDV